MTDNEIIKALNGADGLGHISIYCADNNGKDVRSIKLVDIIDLINRQKAEIERLTGARNADPMDFCGVLCRYSEELITKAKAEAVKELAERLKKTSSAKKYKLFVAKADIDNLVKEMVGDDK